MSTAAEPTPLAPQPQAAAPPAELAVSPPGSAVNPPTSAAAEQKVQIDAMEAEPSAGVAFPKGSVVVVACEPPDPFWLAVAREDIPHLDESASGGGVEQLATVSVRWLERDASFGSGDDTFRYGRDDRVRRQSIICAATVEPTNAVQPGEHLILRMSERFRILKFIQSTYPSRDEDEYEYSPPPPQDEDGSERPADKPIEGMTAKGITAKAVAGGSTFYLVKWRGFGRAMTWEPRETVESACPNLVARFENASCKLDITFPPSPPMAPVAPPSAMPVPAMLPLAPQQMPRIPGAIPVPGGVLPPGTAVTPPAGGRGRGTTAKPRPALGVGVGAGMGVGKRTSPQLPGASLLGQPALKQQQMMAVPQLAFPMGTGTVPAAALLSPTAYHAQNPAMAAAAAAAQANMAAAGSLQALAASVPDQSSEPPSADAVAAAAAAAAAQKQAELEEEAVSAMVAGTNPPQMTLPPGKRRPTTLQLKQMMIKQQIEEFERGSAGAPAPSQAPTSGTEQQQQQ